MGGVNGTHCETCMPQEPCTCLLDKDRFGTPKIAWSAFPRIAHGLAEWQNGRMAEWPQSVSTRGRPICPAIRVLLTCCTPHALSSLHTLPGQVAPGTAGEGRKWTPLAPQTPQGKTKRLQASACLLERCDPTIDREVQVRKIPNESAHEFVPASPTHVPETLAT